MYNSVQNKIFTAYQNGFSITPPYAKGEKKPSGKNGEWKQYQTTRASKEQMKSWYEKHDGNYGIICGKVSNLIVVDADNEDAVKIVETKLPKTPFFVSTGKGKHFYYKSPQMDIQTESWGGGEVRSEGAQVVGFGSIHETGKIYTESGDLLELWKDVPTYDPAWLELLGEKEKPKRANGESSKETKQEGGDTFFNYGGVRTGEGRWAALCHLVGCHLRKGDSRATIIGLALAWNESNEPPIERDKVIRDCEGLWEKHQDQKEYERQEKVREFYANQKKQEEATEPQEKKPTDEIDGLLRYKKLKARAQSNKPFWIIKDLVASGEIQMPVSLPWGGKSTTIASAVVSVCEGRKWFDYDTLPTPVLYVNADRNSDDLFISRLTPHIKNEDECDKRFFITDIEKLDTPVEKLWLIQKIREIKELTKSETIWVVVDTIRSAFITGLEAGGENDSTSMVRILTFLRAIAVKEKVAITLMHHCNKLDEFSGSTGIAGAVDTWFKIYRDEGSNIATCKLETRRKGQFAILQTERLNDGSIQKYERINEQHNHIRIIFGMCEKGTTKNEIKERFEFTDKQYKEVITPLWDWNLIKVDQSRRWFISMARGSKFYGFGT